MFVKMINNLKGDSDKHREVNSETGCESTNVDQNSKEFEIFENKIKQKCQTSKLKKSNKNQMRRIVNRLDQARERIENRT